MTLAAPVIRDGTWFDRLYDGWDEVARADVADGMIGLVLRRAGTGQTVCWYLALDGNVLGTHAAFLDDSARAALLEAAGHWARPLVAGSLSGAPGPDVAAIQLPAPLLTEIACVWAAQEIGTMAIYPASWAQTGGTLSGPSGLAIEEARLAALLESRVSSKALVVASPFTGAPLRAQIVLDCDDLSVHRFYDPEQDAAFYLSWLRRATMERPSFFCPNAHLIVSDQPDPAFLPGRILAWYARHPDHAARIAQAVPFQPEDYGLGRASALGDLPSGTIAAETTPEPAGSDSRAWALLRTGDMPQAKATPPAAPARPGLLTRLFGRRRPKA